MAETNVWTAKKTTGDSPKAMSSSGAVYGNNLYVFGGVLNGEAQNTLHCLDISEFMIISSRDGMIHDLHILIYCLLNITIQQYIA